MARVDDVISLAEGQARQFADLLGGAAALANELHDQGWDTSLDPTFIVGGNLDIAPPNATLSARQQDAHDRLSAGLVGYRVLMASVMTPLTAAQLEALGVPQAQAEALAGQTALALIRRMAR